MLQVLTNLKQTPALVKEDLTEFEQSIIGDLLENGKILKQMKVPEEKEEVFYVKNQMQEEYLKLTKPKEKHNTES